MKFYSKIGLSFRDWRFRLENVPDLDLMISGAPLGDELTLFDDYDGYGLNLSITNPTARIRASLWSLKEEIQWNTSRDNLIHCTKLSGDVEFFPKNPRFSYPDNFELAARLYAIAKSFYSEFAIDRVSGDSEHYVGAFEWTKNHDVQKVITFFEENRKPTESELASDSWSQWWPTEKVFPHLVRNDIS